MRRGNHPSFIKAGDTIIGINLSSDFCAEHEWVSVRSKGRLESQKK